MYQEIKVVRLYLHNWINMWHSGLSNRPPAATLTLRFSRKHQSLVKVARSMRFKNIFIDCYETWRPPVWFIDGL
jgi:hypothetical protein